MQGVWLIHCMYMYLYVEPYIFTICIFHSVSPTANSTCLESKCYVQDMAQALYMHGECLVGLWPCDILTSCCTCVWSYPATTTCRGVPFHLPTMPICIPLVNTCSYTLYSTCTCPFLCICMWGVLKVLPPPLSHVLNKKCGPSYTVTRVFMLPHPPPPPDFAYVVFAPLSSFLKKQALYVSLLMCGVPHTSMYILIRPH